MLGPSRWRPQPGANPAVLALARLPAPPGIVPGFPWALPGGAAAASFDGPEAAHPADGPPAPSGRKAKLMTSTLSAILSALELGHLDHTVDLRTLEAPPPAEAMEQTVSAVWSDLFALFPFSALERDIEDLGWGLVNLFHRAAAKKHQMIDRLTDEIRLLLAEQDGSEVATADLEDKIDLARKIEQSAEAYETMRDTAARHYLHETGRSWVPATGNRISLGTTAAIVDGRSYLQARRERVRDANMVHGTPVIFAGGRLRFASDDEAKQFADNLLRTLNAVRERVGDMYLVHGGDMKGIERLAASWAEQNGIQQLRFGLDRKLGDRAGFRRNEQMLSVKPRYVIAFQGNGVTERLVIEAKARGIHVVDRRGPLGTPPASRPCG